MDVREKLVELLEKASYECDEGTRDLWDMREVADGIANFLIANGVTVQECGYWVSYQSDEPYGSHDDKEWYKCSKCGKDACGRCYEDEWYSAPILSDYCHHCGAKMLPQPPKGE